MAIETSIESKFDLSAVDAEGFLAELKGLRAEMDSGVGEDDLRHLRRQVRWGNLCTAVGVATSWIVPNPVSAAGLGFGRSWGWILRHHILHHAYDRVPGVPAKYTSKVFGRGRRRFIDVIDWLPTEAWVYEHNVLHHAYTSDMYDPDLIERNAQGLLGPLPRFLRYVVLFIASLVWRPILFAPNSYRAWQERGRHKEATFGGYTWKRVIENFFNVKYLLYGFLPVAALLFVVFPLLFVPLGWWAVFSVLCNSLMGEAIGNLHIFYTVVPDHAGSDLYRYDDTPKSRAEMYVRQVISTVNYRTDSDFQGFATLWLNYHIEHHVFPNLSLLKYKQVQPKLKALCAKYGLPYNQQSVWLRIGNMINVLVGRTPMPRATGSIKAAPRSA